MDKIKVTIILLFLFIQYGNAQRNITGQVVDDTTGEALIAALITDGTVSTTTDYNGNFSFSTSPESTSLMVSYLGYTDMTIDLQSETTFIIRLQPSSNLLETLTFTGSRFEQRQTESTVSIEVIKPELIANINTTNVDQVLEKMPGVQMLDGQANIRGGSGYSFGAGSRVMLLLNDMPILQPDAGTSNFGDMPVENIGQVEILKGSASAAYGSAALNGIINIFTQYATEKPVTELATGYTMYDNFTRESLKNRDAGNNYFISGVHRRKIGKDIDLVVHGNRYSADSFADSTYTNRNRLGFSTKYRITDRLAISLNGMYNRGDNSDFFMWNGTEELLSPLAGTVSKGIRTRYILDPVITYFDRANNRHKLQSRYFYVNNDNNNNQGNASRNYYTEYQFQRNFTNIDLKMTAGLVNQFLITDSQLFSNSKFKNQNLSAYTQFDKKFFGKLNLSLGARYEFNNLTLPDSTAVNGFIVNDDAIDDGQMIYKAGLNYQLKDFTFLRLSYGQGYRYPTIVERFISTQFGSFSIIANPVLKPETGWSSEIGIKQGISFSGIKVFLDAAVFLQRYNDMLEFTFVALPGVFGFQSQNVGNTEISGIDLSVSGKFDVKDISVFAFGGYTFTNPIYRNFENNGKITNTLSDSDSTNVLKYRTKHLFKMDVEATYRNNLSLGIAMLGASHMINIDKILEQQIPGAQEYRTINNKGYTVLNLRTSYKWKNTKISFLIDNLLNNEYTVRPAELQPPRSFSFRLDQKF